MAGLPRMAQREKRILVGGACSLGLSETKVRAFAWGHLGLMESQPKGTAQQGDMAIERVSLEFAIRVRVEGRLQIVNQLLHPSTRVRCVRGSKQGSL